MRPSLQAFNALLEAWAGQGNAFETAMLYDDMRQRSITPDLCTFIALFEVCSPPKNKQTDRTTLFMKTGQMGCMNIACRPFP